MTTISLHGKTSPFGALLAAMTALACGEAQSPTGGGNTGGTSGGTGGGASASAGAFSKGGSSAGGVAGGGGTSNAGTSNSGGSAGTPSGGSGGTPSNSCAPMPLNPNPFGCELAWGAEHQGNRATYLQFVTRWVGSEQQPNASPDACYGCQLVEAIASSPAIPVFYGYIIGEMGHANGLPDCNTGGPPNLCTDGALMIRENWDEIVAYYGNYARRVYETNPSKPVVWLLEGDFIQYHDASSQGQPQQNPLSYIELGDLTRDITCAIKSNQPNAVVAMNHTAWNGDEETDDFWGEMPLDLLDLVWTTGVGNNDGFLAAGANSEDYNARTANYAYISNLTGKKIFVDISYGPSQQEDSWSDQSASTLNQRIAEGVIAINAGTNPASNYQSAIAALAPSLNDACQ